MWLWRKGESNVEVEILAETPVKEQEEVHLQQFQRAFALNDWLVVSGCETRR
jgi:hypothetical protein